MGATQSCRPVRVFCTALAKNVYVCTEIAKYKELWLLERTFQGNVDRA